MNTIQRDYSYGIIPFFRKSLGEYIFFIGRAQDRDGRVGYWKFPKGHKDFDEEGEVDAAIRELREEIGIDIPESAVIASTPFTEEYFYERAPGGDREAGIVRKKNTYWLGQVATQGEDPPRVRIDEKEFKEYKWASFEEAFELLPENSQGFFEEAHSLLVRNRV